MTAEAANGPAPTSALRAAIVDGVLTAAPTMVMVLPFGALSGAIFAETGLTLFEALSFSIVIYAGAAQLASLEMLRDGASMFVIVATGVAINLRFSMYAAVVAPWYAPAPTGLKATVAYFLTDNIIGQAALRYRTRPAETPTHKIMFFLGGGLLSWAGWQAATALGYFVGAAAPPWLGLEFAAPIAFTAIAMQMLSDRPAIVAAVAAATASILLRDIPLNLGVIAATAIGVAAALMAEEIEARRRRSGGHPGGCAS